MSGFLGWVYMSQDSMIYHPDKYMKGDYQLVPPRTVRLEFLTAEGKQSVWYTPPRSATDDREIPRTLWILYNGNASLALFWSDAIKRSPDDNAGFLMFDYPGYGDSEGKPTRTTIKDTNEGALAALAEHLSVSTDVLTAQKIRLLGYSLGGAIALEFATRHPVDRIVLAAPFTTMRALADRIVKPHLSWLLRHRYDNLKSLETLSRQASKPRIIVTHGVPDPAVPVEMSRELKRRWPAMIELVEIEHASHTSILDNIEIYMADDLPRPVESLDKLVSQAGTDPKPGVGEDLTTATAGAQP